MEYYNQMLILGGIIGITFGFLIGSAVMNYTLTEGMEESQIPQEVQNCAGYIPKQVEYDSYGDIIYITCGEFRWGR